MSATCPAAKIGITGLSKEFMTGAGLVRAIDDVTFEVRDREFVCVIGPSGCGKSTLLFILAGLLRPSTGRIEIDGALVTGPGSDRAVVFQDDAVFPWLNVYDNIAFGPSLRKSRHVPTNRNQAVNRYVELVGLTGFERSFPRQLSGGMRKRVDLARALANDPEVLLMDEPFGSLDVFTRERLQIETLRIWEATRKTIVFVTHDLEEALFLSDRIVVMTKRPARIATVIDNPFSRPRDLRLRSDSEFQHLRQDLWEFFSKEHE